MISCGDYDYIEIVCMHRYPVRLTLKLGECIEGTALDTARDENKQECIKLETETEQQLVVLDNLTKLDVLVENPHFRVKRFV
ncbi:transcriptional regulator [Vibrio sp. RE86]|uniref:Rho-binding antiterminator n=1 Tax=Vibrio sp. RE86 TaxID=2607605 RepID=UPI001493C0A4|nr:Rho-binding antiterminator [Vibrio sp. RE86]NOH80043.1 transcriptional regulator [Vibrio sp. RE86]